LCNIEKILMKNYFAYRFRRFSAHSLLSLGLSITLVYQAFAGQANGVATKPVSDLTVTESEIAAAIKSETIREVTADLSSEQMQGRGTTQPGGDKAAQYIADRFTKLGLKPIGQNGSFFQKVNFKETQILAETAIKSGDKQLQYGDDFVISPPYSGDRTVSGYLAFVAFGMVTAMPKRNDLAGLDLRNKIVLLLDGPPKNVSIDAWDKSEIQNHIIQNLFGLGAKAILITNFETEPTPYPKMADYLIRRQLSLADEAEPPAEIPPFALISREGAEKLFSDSGTTYAEALAKAEQGEYVSQVLKKSTSITVRLKKGKGASNNVMGLLEGSDIALKEEALIYTAHYDAYGVGTDGRIYPGAADNALGVAEMIAIAEGFKKLPSPPRRSIIFLAVTGEEYGLLGTEYWLKNSTWKLKKVAANLNFDGVGTEVYDQVKRVVGYGIEHSDLGNILKDVVKALNVEIIPDPMPEEKTFVRSDHYAFVKRGIPALMLLGAPDGDPKIWLKRLKTWQLTDYHQPTDTIRPEWNWQGPRTLAVIGFVVGYRVANATDMPKWFLSSPFNRSRGSSEPMK
jgi:Zn-dependent M28 family amino/carboxypeptidase